MANGIILLLVVRTNRRQKQPAAGGCRDLRLHTPREKAILHPQVISSCY